jgi:hypothetical protein
MAINRRAAPWIKPDKSALPTTAASSLQRLPFLAPVFGALYGYGYNMRERRPRRPVRRRPKGPFASLGAAPGYALVQHWRIVPTDGPYVLDGLLGKRRIAAVLIAIDERATIARLAEGWVVLGARHDADAELPDETDILRRAAVWIVKEA